MFRKQQPDYSQYEQDMASFQERTDLLEGEANRVVHKLNKMDLYWHNEMTDAKRNVQIASRQVAGVKSSFEGMAEGFRHLVKQFRVCVLREDYKKVENKINRMQFEEFITRKEFEELLDS